MFNVIHLITGLSTGGAERALFNLLNGGLGAKFNCHVISLIDEGTIGSQIKDIGVPVSALGMRKGVPSFSSLNKLRKLVSESQPDVIQGWMYHGNLASTIACNIIKESPVLAWNVRHSLYDLNKEKFTTQQVIRLNRFFSSRCDALLYNSQLSQMQHEAFGFASNNGRVIPNGIDVRKFFYSALHRQRIRTELGIPENALVVGHVARFHPMKDHSLFLKAAASIALLDLNIHFILSGRDVSIENKNIRQLVPIELGNRFHLIGERNDVPELMCAMDVFCQSSWSEAFPNVIGEAMATKIPCVATDVGDSRIIIGDTGVIVPARAEKELVSGIKKLLSLSHQERQYLGEKARTRIVENYTLSAIVDQYSLLYEKLIALKRVR